MTQLKNHFIAALAVFTIALVGDDAAARGFRVGLFPNGVVNSCSNCHDNPNGGGPRNLFGSDVGELVSPGGFEPFWSPELAAEDSDSDGFTNGQEVGDIDGDGVPERTVNISLPGVAGDTPIAALGDCNLDTELNEDDLSCVSEIAGRDAILSALNSLPGDLDGNGQVEFLDFLVLSNNFGTDATAYSDGNIDLVDGVAFADFLVLSSNFGQSGSGALSSVPEPSSSSLGAISIFCFLVSRRYRKRRA